MDIQCETRKITIKCPKCNEIDYSISEDFNGYVICVPSDLEIL